MNRFMFFAIFLLTSACASPVLSVRSVPSEAEVTFVTRDGRSTHLGKTPLQVSSTHASGLFAESGALQVYKDGFLLQSALVPKLGAMGGDGSIDFTLSQAALPKICNANSDLVTEVARNIVEITSLIQRKRYADASGQLQGLMTKYPGVAVLYDLKGNIAYLQRDLKTAVEAYKQSNQIAPENMTTKRMLDRLKTMQGGEQ